MAAKKPVVIYHGDCSDGFGGAYAAWKKFGKKAEYFGLKHGWSLPQEYSGREIYFIDIVPSEPVFKQLLKNNRVIALDHHISAQKLVRMANDYRYAINNSGSVVAWKYFHPDKPAPRLLKHIEDTDLWKFKLKNTREIFARLQFVDYDFKKWDKFAKALENPKSRRSAIEKGELILEYERRIVRRLVDNAELVKFEGYKTYAVNSPILESEIGAALVKKLSPIAIIWRQKNGKKVFSLRSNGKVDVSKLAKRYGGGGHKASAGFNIPASKPLPWKPI